MMRGHGAVWFALRNSRSGETTAEPLEECSGWLICDGYKEYDKAAHRARGSPRFAGCCTLRKYKDPCPTQILGRRALVIV
jgi:hypothetical protein